MIYLDANVIIRFVEEVSATRSSLGVRLLGLRGITGAWATSKLSRLECRCKPLRDANKELLEAYGAFFIATETTLLDIDDSVIEKATQLRAQLKIKTPDAIHLASAITAGASAFLTGDLELIRCQSIAVEIV